MARTEGAVGITEAERRIIQISAADGMAVREIAATIERSPKTVYKILAEVRKAPPAQPVLPLGRTDGEK